MTAPEAEPLSTIESALTALAALRPSRVDPAHSSVKAKMPSKIAVLRAGLLYRLVELASVSLQCLKGGQIAAAVILARATLETVAALWFAARKIERAIEARRVVELDDDLMKLLLGCKAAKPCAQTPDAINLLTFFKHMGKEVQDIELIYADLSEYAHPNWSGAASLYSRPDLVNLRLDFHATQSANTPPVDLTRKTLEISVIAFQHLHKQIDSLMPQLIELTESALNP